MFYPIWQFVLLRGTAVPVVRKYHQPVVLLASNYPADALRRLTHRVKYQKVGLFHPFFFIEVLQSLMLCLYRKKNPTLGVLEGHPKHDDRSAVMVVEINAFSDFTSSYSQKYRAATAVTGLSELSQRLLFL